jgi:NAD(P)-dependent dehydrogenase (short-subunit alcohol dehydrogenase family)
MNKYQFTNDEWAACIKVLQALQDNPFDNPDNDRFKTLVTAVHRKAQKQKRKANAVERREHDNALIKATEVVSNAQNIKTNYSHTDIYDEREISLQNQKRCYCCNEPYTQLHFFYHRLCPTCASLNYEYRNQEYDFSGYNVIVTGGRVKVGYATALKFLRSGANVLLTTRFPALALAQLQQESDYSEWQNKLIVYGLDLRSLIAVENFINFCRLNYDGIDILINNAAQTIKYPTEYYQPLIARESLLLLKLSTSKLLANTTPVVEQHIYLPLPDNIDITLNRFGQPIDHRGQNSWNSLLEEINLEELLEVNLINHIAPYRLIAGLKEQMKKSKNEERFIVNVTSSEGQFSYENKTVFHPHTNMTKAALNMLTRTSAAELVKDGIYMTAVDVGWISTGAVESKRAAQFDNLKVPPLDPVDGAMRIIHPIAGVLQGDKSLYGILLKDYKIAKW